MNLLKGIVENNSYKGRMTMSLAKYEIFSTVVEEGSLSRAADKLSLSQSAVSHAITGLEREWGFRLLSRGKSGIRLTQNGEQVLKIVREILRWNEQLSQEISKINGIEGGTVRIGTFTSVSVHWLPDILKSFHENYPNIDVKLVEGDYSAIEEWVVSGAIDFGFVSLPTAYSLESIPLTKDRMQCLLPSGHPLANLRSISPLMLKDEQFIVSKKGSDNDVNRIFKETGLKPKIRFELGDDQAIISMVANGLGVSILPELVLYQVPDNIRVIPIEGDFYRTIGLTAVSVATISPAAKKMIHYIRQAVENPDSPTK